MRSFARGITVPSALAAGTGSGTVTHSAGALTAGQLVIGNGTDDVKVRPFWFYDVTNVAYAGGAVGDGVADDSAAVIAAIAAAQAVGGEVYFPAGTYRIDSQLVIPNDGGGIPKQRPLRLIGAGALMNGEGGSPYGGSILDLRYVGTAKIDTRGLGLLEMFGLTLEDTTDGTTDFLHTTNTTLHLHETAFFGKTAGATAAQDAIVTGGLIQTIDGAFAAPFQGYGTLIDGCYFSRIRRGVYGKTYTNGISVVNNTWWNTCGGVAALESDGAGDTNVGWYIAGNLIEETNYTYAMKFTRTTNSTIIGNNLYDVNGTTSAHYRFDTLGQYNLLIPGYHNDTVNTISETASVVGTNNILHHHQSQTTIWQSPFRLTNVTNEVKNSSSQGIITVDTLGNSWAHVITSSGLNHTFRYTASGGAADDVLTLRAASATDKRLQIRGSSNSRLEAPTGPLQVYSEAGQALSLGDATNKATITDGKFSAVSIRGVAVAFASLPAAPVEGMLVPVTNSTTATWGATIAGGGANHVLAYYNGTNWTVAGA